MRIIYIQYYYNISYIRQNIQYIYYLINNILKNMIYINWQIYNKNILMNMQHIQIVLKLQHWQNKMLMDNIDNLDYMIYLHSIHYQIIQNQYDMIDMYEYYYYYMSGMDNYILMMIQQMMIINRYLQHCCKYNQVYIIDMMYYLYMIYNQIYNYNTYWRIDMNVGNMMCIRICLQDCMCQYNPSNI